MRLPPWLFLVLVLFAVGTPVGWAIGYFTARAEFSRYRHESEALVARLHRERTSLEDSVQAALELADSLRARRDTVVVRVRVAIARVDTTASDLRAYLAADSVGLKLFTEYAKAVERRLELSDEEVALALAEIEQLRRSLALKDAIISAQDSAIGELRVNLEAAIAEGEKWYRKAHPPFTIRALEMGLECGASALAAWAATDEAIAGVSAAGGCLLVRATL